MISSSLQPRLPLTFIPVPTSVSVKGPLGHLPSQFVDPLYQKIANSPETCWIAFTQMYQSDSKPLKCQVVLS